MARSLLYGVGINDAPYSVVRSEYIDGKWKQVWRCPAYAAWSHVMERSFSLKKAISQPTYKDVTCCDDWLRFTTFLEWWEENHIEGYQLDKDILVYGNKIYSPENCLYVPRWVNQFVTERNSRRGSLPIGVSWSKKYKFYESNISIGGCKKFLGHFNCPYAAHDRWKLEKLTLVGKYRDKLDEIDSRLYPALIYRYANYKTEE